MSVRKALDGNAAAAEGARLARVQVVAAYPITPPDTHSRAAFKLYRKWFTKSWVYQCGVGAFSSMSYNRGISGWHQSLYGNSISRTCPYA